MKQPIQIIFLFLLLQNTFAQQIEHIGLDKGLSSGHVFDFLQSKEGFIYIGLHTGINRYDGRMMEHFAHNPFDTFSISPQAVSCLWEDGRGYIWVGMESGALDVFNPRTQRFHHLGKYGDQVSKEQLIIKDVIEDPNGHIWLALHNKKIIKLEIPKKFDLAYMPADIAHLPEAVVEINIGINPNYKDKSLGKAPLGKPKSLFLDSKNKLWAGTLDGQIIEIDWQNNHPNVIFQGRSFHEIFTDNIFENSKGEIWFWSGRQFHVLKDNKVQTMDGGNLPSVQHFLGFDEKDNFIVAIEGADKESGVARLPAGFFISENPTIEKLLPKSYIGLKHFLIDKSGNYWFAHTFGLLKYNPARVLFRPYLKNKTIYKLTTDIKGNIFFFWYGHGLFHLNSNGELAPISSLYPKITFPVRNMVCKKSGVIWGEKISILTPVGRKTLAKKFFQFDPNTGELKEFNFPIKIAQGWNVLLDKNQEVWAVGNENELLKMKADNQSYISFKDQKIIDKIGKAIRNNSLYEDINNQIWVATNKGAIRTNSNELPEKEPDFELFQNNPNDPESLSDNIIKCFHDDPFEPQKYIWIGTEGGLNRLDRITKKSIHFTTRNSDIPDNVIYQIQTDGAGRLWLSTNKGLSRFDIKTGIFKNFTREDGLQNMEFNTNSSLKLPTGELLFGGVKGLNYFHPDSLKFNDFVPDVHITELKINNEKALTRFLSDATGFKLKQAIEYTQSINLKYDQNTIGLQFAAMDFSNSAKNQFRYKLTRKGIFENKESGRWVDLGNENKVQFTNLSPGNYIFEIKGSNNHQVWNNTPTVLEITIRPPWHQTNWAYLIYALTLLAAIFWLYRFQIKRTKLRTQLVYEHKEAERLAELDRIKTDFFSNITHEFRTPLTLILEPVRQMLKENQNGHLAQRLHLVKNNSEKLLQLVNQLLDVSKLEAGKMTMDLRKGNVLEILRPIFQSFLVLAEKKNIDLKWSADKDIPRFYFDKNLMGKIFYNLLSNAIKFTEKGEVTASLSEVDFNDLGYLYIKVKDTGIGIPKNQIAHIFDRFYQVDSSSARKEQGTGIGLALTKELVELMGGKIEVESKIGAGSEFMVWLPMEVEATSFPRGGNVGGKGKGVISTDGNIEGISETELEMTPFSRPPTSLPLEKDVTSSPPLILLIEDNAELRQFLKQSLENNYQIIEASHGAEGIQKAKELIPDLIVSDLMMPGKDGHEVVEDLKNDVKTSHIPIIILTAKTAIESKLKGLRGGADDYLTKPFNTEELLVRMENLIALRQKLMEKYQQMTLAQKEVPPVFFSTLDQDFLQKTKRLINENLGNETLSTEMFARQMLMSRSQLHRKLKALTNQSATEFIRNYRLDRAKEMLKNKEGNVMQVSMMVGFSNEKYFSTRFKERFGLSPSEV